MPARATGRVMPEYAHGDPQVDKVRYNMRIQPDIYFLTLHYWRSEPSAEQYSRFVVYGFHGQRKYTQRWPNEKTLG